MRIVAQLAIVFLIEAIMLLEESMLSLGRLFSEVPIRGRVF